MHAWFYKMLAVTCWEAEGQNYLNRCGKRDLDFFSGLHWHVGYAKVSSIELDVIIAKEKGMFFASDFLFFPQAVVLNHDLERDVTDWAFQ